MNRFARRVLVLLLCYAVVCAIAGIVVADGTLHPARRPLDAQAINEAQQLAYRTTSTLQDVAIRTADHVLLKAWLITPNTSNGDAVLLFHGLSDNRIGMIGYAEFLLTHHYQVLMPDARAHGQSEGTIATYGLLERQDIRDWVAWLNAGVHPRCVFGLGESMGAAQLLQSLGKHGPFCAVAAESSFSDLREIGYDRVGQFFRTGPWLGRTILRPIIEISFLYSRWKYGLDLRNVSPAAAATNTDVPILLIHGKIDSNIPVRHSRIIKSEAPKAVLWEVPGADHCGAISVARDQFFTHLMSWFQAAEENRSPTEGPRNTSPIASFQALLQSAI